MFGNSFKDGCVNGPGAMTLIKTRLSSEASTGRELSAHCSDLPVHE